MLSDNKVAVRPGSRAPERAATHEDLRLLLVLLCMQATRYVDARFLGKGSFGRVFYATIPMAIKTVRAPAIIFDVPFRSRSTCACRCCCRACHADPACLGSAAQGKEAGDDHYHALCM
jgi:hypothetical protein